MGRDTLWVLLAGGLFGAGLTVSTMIEPEVVIAFLRLQDLGLLLVLGGAVTITFFAYRLVPRLLAQPIAGERFASHAATLSRNTVLGAALFGVGWAIAGVCPGPAFAGIGAGNWTMLLPLAGMFAGAWIHGRFLAKP
ncbi:MAG: YeeE/YedE family protein [Planctomycetes bacterium]|nr:YeeE/YedE family protein [Planctomycetota bacterium]